MDDGSAAFCSSGDLILSPASEEVKGGFWSFLGSSCLEATAFLTLKPQSGKFRNFLAYLVLHLVGILVGFNI